MEVLGLDIGGANLKAAHARGAARLVPFALWKRPELLPERLRELLDGLPPWDVLAVTMTGELCDCFENKRAGVRAILDAVRHVAEPSRVRLWSNLGRFVAWDAATHDPLMLASANWRALAQFALTFADSGPGLLVDVGSTTTDIIPWENGVLKPRGLTVTERLRAGELIYQGVKRTPLCAVLGAGHAAEFFATMWDALLVLHVADEDPEDCDTADGRPATRSAAAHRVARMVCGDAQTCSPSEVTALARRAVHNVVHSVRTGVDAVAKRSSAPPATIVLAGSGEFLLQRWHAEIFAFPLARVVSLGQELGPQISACACAYALARLCGRPEKGHQ